MEALKAEMERKRKEREEAAAASAANGEGGGRKKWVKRGEREQQRTIKDHAAEEAEPAAPPAPRDLSECRGFCPDPAHRRR